MLWEQCRRRYLKQGVSKKAKVEVYSVMVVPMLTYGCDSWVLREREKTRLQASGMSVLRKIAGVTRLDCIRNEIT